MKNTRPLAHIRHESYYIYGADLYLQVGSVSFCVHKYFFERESDYFVKRLYGPTKPGVPKEGSSESNAMFLEDTTPQDFCNFLWVFYNPKYSIWDASEDVWISILRQAHIWRFPEVKLLAVREIEKLDVEHITRIANYNAYEVDSELLLPDYTALCSRREPLTLEEAKIVGLEVAIKINQTREMARCSLRMGLPWNPPPVILHREEMQEILHTIFNLGHELSQHLKTYSPVPHETEIQSEDMGSSPTLSRLTTPEPELLQASSDSEQSNDTLSSPLPRERKEKAYAEEEEPEEHWEEEEIEEEEDEILINIEEEERVGEEHDDGQIELEQEQEGRGADSEEAPEGAQDKDEILEIPSVRQMDVLSPQSAGTQGEISAIEGINLANFTSPIAKPAATAIFNKAEEEYLAGGATPMPGKGNYPELDRVQEPTEGTSTTCTGNPPSPKSTTTFEHPNLHVLTSPSVLHPQSGNFFNLESMYENTPLDVKVEDRSRWTALYGSNNPFKPSPQEVVQPPVLDPEIAPPLANEAHDESRVGEDVRPESRWSKVGTNDSTWASEYGSAAEGEMITDTGTNDSALPSEYCSAAEEEIFSDVEKEHLPDALATLMDQQATNLSIAKENNNEEQESMGDGGSNPDTEGENEQRTVDSTVVNTPTAAALLNMDPVYNPDEEYNEGYDGEGEEDAVGNESKRFDWGDEAMGDEESYGQDYYEPANENRGDGEVSWTEHGEGSGQEATVVSRDTETGNALDEVDAELQGSEKKGDEEISQPQSVTDKEDANSGEVEHDEQATEVEEDTPIAPAATLPNSSSFLGLSMNFPNTSTLDLSGGLLQSGPETPIDKTEGAKEKEEDSKGSGRWSF